MESLEEVYVVKPLSWAQELNVIFRALGMPYGYEVVVKTDPEMSINYGEQYSLNAHYEVSHPKSRRVRRAWTDFIKDRNDDDDLEKIARDYVVPMIEVINSGLLPDGDPSKARIPKR